jgi:hypothetical protein
MLKVTSWARPASSLLKFTVTLAPLRALKLVML